MPDLTADTVASLLRDGATRTATLEALELHEGTPMRDGSVVPALETVAGSGLTQESRELAAAALSALSDKKLVMAVEGQKHIMLSCELVGARVYSIT